MDERAGWTSGALAGSLVAGLAISGLMIAEELQSGKPSDLIAWERAGAERLGLSTPSTKAMPGLAEQSGVQAEQLALSAAATSRGAPA
ncbi:hypothetical protein LGH83_08735 [Lichenihabitans sp. PAMC28606]|uniref:hypothetical protein n=1 Tax=Lichenihabitans sp. PAMC28606 TaxID=2880932 RepID=UPI001D09CBF0|nr:hypothetical protein [Lichenihabitans sp. PAMC28606]UDL96246.1 hypothetical protein LGH83_08735 [Lichenihabitans sp. PAMC28606]